MPDVIGFVSENIGDGVVHVALRPRAWEYDDAKLHAVNRLGLARRCAHICETRELSVFLGRFSALADLGRDLLLASDTRRLESLAASRFGNDAFVLDAAGESAQHRLEALTLSVLYLYQLKSFLLWSNPMLSVGIEFPLP